MALPDRPSGLVKLILVPSSHPTSIDEGTTVVIIGSIIVIIF